MKQALFYAIGKIFYKLGAGIAIISKFTDIVFLMAYRLFMCLSEQFLAWADRK